MAAHLLKRTQFAALLLGGGLAAQQAAAPKFEVVSIRPVPRNLPPVMRDAGFTPVLRGGQFVHSRASLPLMITIAYDVKNPSTQLVGLPNWAKDQSYEVAAKPAEGFPSLPPAENTAQVRLMLRAMLADRFHLQVHTDTREEAILRLEVAKGGIKFKKWSPPYLQRQKEMLARPWGTAAAE